MLNNAPKRVRTEERSHSRLESPRFAVPDHWDVLALLSTYQLMGSGTICRPLGPKEILIRGFAAPGSQTVF
jgi:hypothetical protein